VGNSHLTWWFSMSSELGIASVGSLALPLEIDEVWLPTCPSWNKGSAAISEPHYFPRCSEPRVTGLRKLIQQ
jgi:hypothetical protein